MTKRWSRAQNKMFGFFKRKSQGKVEIDLLVEVFKRLPFQFEHFKGQVETGLIKKGFKSDVPFRNTLDFSFDVELLNRYEVPKDRSFYLRGIEVFDKTLNDWSEFIVECGFGLVMGYSTPRSSEFAPDVSRIRLTNFRREYIDEGALAVMREFLDQSEIELINPSDFYEVFLNDKVFYHVADLEDGDFVGIDRHKKIYKITHDPFEIKLLDGDIPTNLLRL